MLLLLLLLLLLFAYLADNLLANAGHFLVETGMTGVTRVVVGEGGKEGGREGGREGGEARTRSKCDD